ncbi:Predicted phage phi-C31 gp36 major capsid-like protein [Brevundimonas diminuta]|uniref:phage major capsid protein n=1 Tax=Brevundimonas diminuta TaxID=293 RepID=UPI000D916364|nr:phage major capsid protein [Brevundimonas diminuta]SPU44840.1 Predicted phage phi-C31 gp36 major capsid-like protein [Brevundimonas diminuta]
MTDQTKSAAELAAEIKADFGQKLDAVKEMAEKAVADAQKGADQSAAQKEVIDNALTGMNEAKARLDELEQKMARGGPAEDDRQKSIGEQFVESDGFKAFEATGFAKTAQRGDMQIKATLTSATTAAAGSVGDAVQTTRLPGILELPQRRLTVRDLLSQGRMDGSTLEYVKETGFNNNAAPVAEAAAKPESDLQFDLVTTSAKVIAHWMKASRQILSDVSQLRSTIDQRLLYGLSYVEEQQLLNGSGTGQNLHGIIPQATAYAAPITIAGATSIDMMRLAMLQAALAEYPATGHVMNPIDWAFIETLKDSDGRYIIGNPQGSIAPTLWGLPVVTTQAIAVDKFLTGAFKLGAQVFDRWDARVETGYVNDDFTKNLVTILAEERLALAVYRPEAFIFGDFGRVT